MKLFLFLAGCTFVSTSCLFAQKLMRLIPAEIGINGFTQRTQTLMHYHLTTPYFNTHGYNHGLGINAQYTYNPKWSIKLFYHYAKLINSYNITKNPLFSNEDKREWKPFSYYWISHEVGMGFKYKFYTQKKSGLSFEQSLCTNYGQLVSGHFPAVLFADSTIKNIVYQDGIPAKLNYTISQISVRNMGLNILNGITYEREVTQKLKLNLNLCINYGFIPLVGTRIDYTITSNERKGSVIGRYYATSNNSGIRLGFGINYCLK